MSTFIEAFQKTFIRIHIKYLWHPPMSLVEVNQALYAWSFGPRKVNFQMLCVKKHTTWSSTMKMDQDLDSRVLRLAEDERLKPVGSTFSSFSRRSVGRSNRRSLQSSLHQPLTNLNKTKTNIFMKGAVQNLQFNPTRQK